MAIEERHQERGTRFRLARDETCALVEWQIRGHGFRKQSSTCAPLVIVRKKKQARGLRYFLRAQEPIDETGQTLAQPGGWIVTEQFPRFGNVRASQGHIAGLLRQPVNFRFFSKRIFDLNNQVFELNGLALAKI